MSQKGVAVLTFLASVALTITTCRGNLFGNGFWAESNDWSAVNAFGDDTASDFGDGIAGGFGGHSADGFGGHTADGFGDGTADGRGEGTGDGRGDGTGDGRGDGTGDGHGDGTGDGQGEGKGDGHGEGTGDGRGDGTGDGRGDGTGDGHGDGTGDGQGEGKGDGHGEGTGDGRGDGTSDGRGEGTGDGRGEGSADGRGDGTVGGFGGDSSDYFKGIFGDKNAGDFGDGWQAITSDDLSLGGKQDIKHGPDIVAEEKVDQNPFHISALFQLKLSKGLNFCGFRKGQKRVLPNPDQRRLLTKSAKGNFNYNDFIFNTPSRGKRSDSKMTRIKSKRSGRPHDPHAECEFLDTIECDARSKFRTIDGSCNNLEHPLWGMAETPLVRFMPSAYEDGRGAPRSRGKSGRLLPKPREIRLKIHEKSLPKHQLENINHFGMSFGQFLSHDMLENIKSETPDGEDLECCGIHKDDPNCIMPIDVHPNDLFFGQFGVTCLNFARSFPSPDLHCNYDTRQQITEYTMPIDVSSTYGSNVEEYEGLRENSSGLLRVQDHPVDMLELMPVDPEGGEDCQPKRFQCFLSGDGRVNQNAGLIMQHTAWLREHNRIARILEDLNPHWDDERLFQEARRIVGAQFQHITYNEYLPVILGPEIMEHFDLNPMPPGEYFKGYDPKVMLMIRAGFMVAAFRFGHSMINDNFGFRKSDGSNERIPLRKLLNNPDDIYREEGFERIVRGLYDEHSQSVDRFKTEEVSNHLFEEHGKPGTGNDLISTNINRGRDHGVPGYMEYRRMCKLPTSDSFCGLTDHTKDVINLLKNVYEHVEDIDLFTGGVTEEPLPGAVVGPTFACIIGLQFKALKFGDRFYYENNEENTKFTIEQLNEIKNVTLAQVLCRNSNIGKVQVDVFKHRSAEVNCSSIETDIDFSFWKDTFIPQN
ncbi:chorion peroxidase-like [Saccostrea echinata]|uniref:chorion peroxidase-like n=1 Tax=Saccostrea echinata TaxID=191078 RepID=UPI002A7F21BC|nr:chorion peroxidase-like [Saccostrea echinata]